MSSSRKLIEFAERITEHKKALRKYARKLRMVAKEIERFIEGEITADEVLKHYSFSPDGDGHGCSNHYIEPVTDGENQPCKDIEEVLRFLESAGDNLKHIISRMEAEE